MRCVALNVSASPVHGHITYRDQWINKGLMLAVLYPMFVYSDDFNHIARRGSTFECSCSRAWFTLLDSDKFEVRFCRQLLLRGSVVGLLGFFAPTLSIKLVLKDVGLSSVTYWVEFWIVKYVLKRLHHIEKRQRKEGNESAPTGSGREMI